MANQHEHNTAGRTEEIQVLENNEMVTYIVYHCTCGAAVTQDKK